MTPDWVEREAEDVRKTVQLCLHRIDAPKSWPDREADATELILAFAREVERRAVERERLRHGLCCIHLTCHRCGKQLTEIEAEHASCGPMAEEEEG